MTEQLIEGTIDRMSFGFTLELLIAGSVITIEDSVILTGSSGELSYNPEEPEQGIEKVITLLRSEVIVSIDDDSSLTLQKADGTLQLVVQASEECEAWSVALADGSRYVSQPDGSVGRWSTSA